MLNGRLQSEHISVLESQLTDLRHRFGIVPAENKYENFTKVELQQIATPLLRNFRSFINESRIEFGKLFNESPRGAPLLEQTPEALEFNNKFVVLNSKYQDRYDRDFKVELILLRNAMKKRLPKELHNTSLDQMYQRTNMNSFLLTELADDFERLLKNLP